MKCQYTLEAYLYCTYNIACQDILIKSSHFPHFSRRPPDFQCFSPISSRHERYNNYTFPENESRTVCVYASTQCHVKSCVVHFSTSFPAEGVCVHVSAPELVLWVPETAQSQTGMPLLMQNLRNLPEAMIRSMSPFPMLSRGRVCAASTSDVFAASATICTDTYFSHLPVPTHASTLLQCTECMDTCSV